MQEMYSNKSYMRCISSWSMTNPASYHDNPPSEKEYGSVLLRIIHTARIAKVGRQTENSEAKNSEMKMGRQKRREVDSRTSDL